ncbi:MAG: riboflavin synthase [Candidatus Saganbacteria bacterium]|nr:riboflavin synthase [Candidatus Saganbacteria bacterium]
MFTGIIEELGVVTSIIRDSAAAKLTVSASKQFAGTRVGESIAINGACLTVTNLRRNFIEFDISKETLNKTTLGILRIGDKVNLERALLISGRMGGHMVTGHVDGVGEIKNKIVSGRGFVLHISIPSALLRYLVSKGSICVDGVSLTVADVRKALLVVGVVPHTAGATTLGAKDIGDRVNIEVDILSKYIERQLRGEVKGVSEEMMVKAGFFPMGLIEN